MRKWQPIKQACGIWRKIVLKKGFIGRSVMTFCFAVPYVHYLQEFFFVIPPRRPISSIVFSFLPFRPIPLTLFLSQSLSVRFFSCGAIFIPCAIASRYLNCFELYLRGFFSFRSWSCLLLSLHPSKVFY